ICAPGSRRCLHRHATCSAFVLPSRASTRSTPAILTRSVMRRRGSPFAGVGIVLAKEAADQLSGVRMVVIEALVFLVALVLAWFSTTTIRESIGESPFLFLRLLTMAPEPIPFSFIDTVGLVAPVIAIACGLL